MKNKITTIVIMLVTISIMTSACVVKTSKKSQEKEDTTAEQEDVTDQSDEKETEPTKSGAEDETSETTTEEATSEPTSEVTATNTTETSNETTTEATDATTAIPQEPCDVIIDITYDENIILAKYTVVLYLDDEKIDSMENGKYFLTKVATTTGDHELKFEKRGDSTFVTTVKVTLYGDSTLIFEIKSHLDEIEIKSSRVADGLQEMEVEMPDVTEMRLDRAIEALEAAGFKNISTESKSPIIMKSNWVVTSQNVSAGDKANRATEIILTCEKDG